MTAPWCAGAERLKSGGGGTSDPLRTPSGFCVLWATPADYRLLITRTSELLAELALFLHILTLAGNIRYVLSSQHHPQHPPGPPHPAALMGAILSVLLLMALI